MLLTIDRPILASQAFTFPEDTTPWVPENYHSNYRKCSGGGKTPIRNRASFGRLQNAVVAHQPDDWENLFGIYILFMEIPSPTIYIGIASEDARVPEGIFSRFKKHRVKITGSHVGNDVGHGGVHHPRKWGAYAIERYNHFGHHRDDLSDLKIAQARIEGRSIQTKSDLERFEKHLFNNCSNVLDAIAKTMWAGNEQPVRLLNHVTKCKHSQTGDLVRLWDDREIRIHD